MSNVNNQKAVSASLHLNNLGGAGISKNGPIAAQHDQIKSGIVGTSLNGPLVTIPQNGSAGGNLQGKSGANSNPGGGSGNY